MINQPVIICVDWGSSNCRAFLMNEAGEIIDSVRSDKGILVLSCAEFEKSLTNLVSTFHGLERLPIILGGMVGSRQGWVETPYVDCPVSIELLANNLTMVPNSSGLNIVIVPGVNAPSMFGQWDVMRGEEVQLFGALSLISGVFKLNQDTILFCMPGTHSKWVKVEVDRKGERFISDFATYMTGEFYNLLVEHSILGRGIDVNISQQVFDEKIIEMARQCANNGGGLMHQLFSARTNFLNNRLAENQVAHYISALIINAEINAMLAKVSEKLTINLIGNDRLNNIYEYVLNKQGRNVNCINAEQAAAQGLFCIAQKASLIKP